MRKWAQTSVLNVSHGKPLIWIFESEPLFPLCYKASEVRRAGVMGCVFSQERLSVTLLPIGARGFLEPRTGMAAAS